MDFFRYFLDQLGWSVPATLLVIAVIQLIYLIWLSSSHRTERRARRPSSPIMPTKPQTMRDDASGGMMPLTRTQGTFTGKMIILSGLPNLGEVDLPGPSFGIGRFRNTDQNILIALDEKSISRRHAVFNADETRTEFYLTDTNSSYGTTVRKQNQFKLLTPGQPERIYDGDVVQFGTLVTVRFVLPGDTRAAATQL